jgi:dipeptidyl aminopeptidase/acylaminoacyl peptidase
MQRIPFVLSEARNGPLRGDVYLPDRARGVPVIVACHGFKGFKDWGFWPPTGQAFAEAGLALVTFNVSGSGIGEDVQQFTEFDRFETNTIGKEIEDLGIVIDALASKSIPLSGADPRKLGVLGHSRGGGVALVRASRDPRIRSGVTWAAVSSFLMVGKEEREAWHERGYLEVENARTRQVFRVGVGLLEELETHREALDPVLAAARIQIPFLVIHGSQDESVPVQAAHQLSHALDPVRGKLLIVDGAGHTFGAQHPFSSPTTAFRLVLERTISWFADTLGV